ncbi:hypothetical protein KKA47_00845, partial [bacterium]|nr:hypothetical protein [bacterium]
IAIHVTHEAIQKIGGIGAVLHGLITNKRYQKKCPHTLLYTPLFDRNGELESRLGKDAQVLYSGLDKYDSNKWRNKFHAIKKNTVCISFLVKRSFFTRIQNAISPLQI